MTIGATVRFFLLHGIDYHEHVTEWGFHWNFFVTIACMNLLMSFITSAKYSLVLGLGILVMSETVSTAFDLHHYVLYAPRKDMISANKEGLASLTGFFVIQLCAVGLGNDMYRTIIYKEPKQLLAEHKSKEGLDKRKTSEQICALRMISYCVLFFMAAEIS